MPLTEKLCWVEAIPEQAVNADNEPEVEMVGEATGGVTGAPLTQFEVDPVKAKLFNVPLLEPIASFEVVIPVFVPPAVP